MIFLPWSPAQPDGGRPQLHILDNRRIFVTYGTRGVWVAELRLASVHEQAALVPVREFLVPVSEATGAVWTGPGILTFQAGGDTWTLDVAVDPWAPTLEPKRQTILAEQLTTVEGWHSVPFLGKNLVAESDPTGRLQVQLLEFMGTKWAGYYYAAGKYGDFHPVQNCIVLGAGMFADGDGTQPAATAFRLLAAARDAGAIFLSADAISVVALRNDWHLVAGLWLTEYGDVADLERAAVDAEDGMRILGLPRRPIIATVMPDQLFEPGWRMPKGVDWLAVEVYFDVPASDFSQQQTAVMNRVMKILDRLPVTVPVVFVGQAYDRNLDPAWAARPDLIAAGLATLAVMAAGTDRVKGIWFFAYARPGGAKTYPMVEAACTSIVQSFIRPDIVTPAGTHALTIRYYDQRGPAPFTCRAIAQALVGTFDTYVWRWRKHGDPIWQTAAVNPASDLDHHFRFTLPGAYEISLRGEYAGGAAETGALRIVTVDPQPTNGPGTIPEGSKMKMVDLPSYDDFLGSEGRAVDDAVRSSTHRPITAAEVRHHGWRRLRENWTLDNIVRAIHGQEPVDLDLVTPDWPGTPTYDELLNVEGPQVDAAFKARHKVKPSAADMRHNLWRRLVEGWTQDNLLKDIKGEPNDGPTLQRPAAGGGQPTGGKLLLLRSGLVRAHGSSAIEDDGGPFVAVGASLFWALWAYRHDRARLEQNLGFLIGRVHYIRVFAVVGPGGGWDDRTVDPNDAGWTDDLAGLTDLAFDHYGIRIEWTIFAGVDTVPREDQQRDVVARLITALQGRFDKVMHFEVANEAGLNGFDGDTPDNPKVQHIRDLARMLADGTPNLVAISAPGSDQQGKAWYAGSRATLTTIHPDRSQNGTGGMWRPARQPWEIHFQDGICSLRSVNEPIGPKSSVAMDADPLRLVMLAVNTWITGSALFVFHTGAGVRGGGAVDQKGGKFYLPREANLFEVENADAILNGLASIAAGLPGDVPNWSKQNGNDRFPDYPFDVGLLTEDRILRAYCGISGPRFIVAPIQIMQPVQFKARKRMRCMAVDALSGQPATAELILNPGESLSLPPSPPAAIIVGEFL